MRDLNEVLDLDLHLPVGGKTYVVKPPDADVGNQLLNRLAFGIAADAGIDLGEEARGQVEVDDDEMPDFGRQCLGPVLDEMVEDKVPWPSIEFCITTAFYAWTLGKPFAEHFWESAGEPSRPAGQSPWAPRTATPTRSAAESTTPTSASASTTPPPAATLG